MTQICTDQKGSDTKFPAGEIRPASPRCPVLICVICGFLLICGNLRFTLACRACQGPCLLMETIGFEPTTPCLQSRCSPG